MIKPDGVKRGLVGEIISRFEKCGLKIIGLEMIGPTRREIDKHYPKDRDWVMNLGRNLLKTGEEFELTIDLKKEYGTDDLHELGKMVREWLLDFMTSGPLIKIVVEGVHAIRMVRKIVGPTIPAFAEMGTIRGDFSVDSPAIANPAHRSVRNLAHASGNLQEAEYEISLWFSPKMIHSYRRSEEDAMF